MDSTMVDTVATVAGSTGSTGLYWGILNAVLLLLVALGVWSKMSGRINAIKEWLDVVFAFIRAIQDANIDEAEKEEILKEWEEAKESWDKPSEQVAVFLMKLKDVKFNSAKKK